MVHSNVEIPTVAKLQYLLQSLEGEAHKIFESVDVVADNYAAVWDNLLKRYDNKRFLKKQLYRALHDLPGLRKESAYELHELADEFQRHVKALAKLGEPIEFWDTPLINMLSYKLDSATIRAWEERARQMDEEDVKFTDLIEFIYQRVRILKSVSSDIFQRAQPALPKVAGNSLAPKKFLTSKIAANAAASESKRSAPSCYACSDKHYLYQCPAFAKMSVSSRRELISHRELCWSCFRTGHHARNCGSKFTCRTCRDRHHTLLHDVPHSDKISSTTPALTAAQEPQPSSIPLARFDHQEASTSSRSQQVSMTVQSNTSTVLLETVALNVVTDSGKVFQARALLDSASMSNFMSKKLAVFLSNRQLKVDVTVAGIGQSVQKMRRSVTTTIKSKIGSFNTKLQFLIIDNPSADLPTVPVQISTFKIPDVPLADPQYCVPSEIDVVIGGEAYWELHTGKKLHLGPGQPHMIETLFGWTFSGPTCIDCAGPTACRVSTNDGSLDATLQRFWEIEAIPTQCTHSAVERTCEEQYNETTTRDTAGRYIVRLPKTDDPEIVLGDSRDIAERRFFSLERRLERSSDVKSAYHQFMAEYERLRHMKRLEEPVDNNIQHCFLPHHPVFKSSSTTTKTRVVFDASCKTASGYSLNDLLLVGPVVQQDLLSLIMRFRTHAIALVGDIEKMYRQIQVHEDDQSLQRILWRTHVGEPIATYQLETVTYGTASAPYLATKTLQRLAKDAGHLFPLAAEPVSSDFYVDDFLSGAPDVQAALQLRREVSTMLRSAGFPIKKWASNSIEVLENVPPEDQAIQPWHDLQDEQSVSTLGLVWEPRSDVFSFKVQLPLPAAVLTKRTIMSYIARIFDPLGLVGPTVTKAKLFMQRMWALKFSDGKRFDWDQPLPQNMQLEWKEFHNTIDLLRQVRVPRFVSNSDATSIELHFFADASEKAYGACCFVRANTSHMVTVQLLTSKSKVAPLATRHTIARLELCASHLSTQLYKKVAAALKSPYTAYFWSGSTTTLQWIRSSPGRWKTFVANRVTHIQLATPVDNWRHIAGIDNPADDISRGLSPAEILEKSRWWHGPEWLTLPPESWPAGALSSAESPETSQENELQSAERTLCRIAQRECFSEERSDLAAGDNVSKSSLLKWLSPQIDQFGTIRVGGRSRNAALPESTKHPIVLSAKHPLADLIAIHYHKTLLHAGPQLMLSSLRQEFWLIGGRNLVRRIFHQCHVCFRKEPQLIQQTVADLPTSRVTPTRPFAVCGIDYCGPFSQNLKYENEDR
ncbi:uncharacterized protein LOC129719668 [Wyeomyia smithii]|uniref:uncharacterized protein LOC129719668 n=1 Tax=Wyeomyia smithii TaxID=174621 RepID=UPI002467CE03|nr:uncharacterized protein LOC129719668 [Wyeomyia smithii]